MLCEVWDKKSFIALVNYQYNLAIHVYYSIISLCILLLLWQKEKSLTLLNFFQVLVWYIIYVHEDYNDTLYIS